MLYRKKALVPAVQWTGPCFVGEDDALPTELPAGVVYMPGTLDGRRGFAATLQTLEAEHTLRPLDWIVTNPAGERYNVADDVFRDTYVPAAAAPSEGLPATLPTYPSREGAPAWVGVIDDLLGVLRGIAWAAGSSPYRVLDGIKARAEGAIGDAKKAGFTYSSDDVPAGVETRGAGPGGCDVDRGPSWRRPRGSGA